MCVHMNNSTHNLKIKVKHHPTSTVKYISF